MDRTGWFSPVSPFFDDLRTRAQPLNSNADRPEVNVGWRLGMGEVDKSKLDRHGRVVAWDAYSGEPVAWLAKGEPVAGTLYGGAGMIAYTHLLTIGEAIDIYGPINEWVVGPQGGFRRVGFGATVFS